MAAEKNTAPVRDLYIDFAKGLATLCIIFIHTAFWSGQLYLPSEIRVLSLLFDVPVFFALSGLTSGSNIEKTLYRLLKLQITYMIFVTLLFFADYFFKVFGLNFFGEETLRAFYGIFGSKYAPQDISTLPQWQNLGNWYLHSYTNCDTFPVVMGSFWYLKVYYILTVFGVLILRFFPKHILWFIGLCFGLTLFFNVFPEYYPTGQVGYVGFYLGLFLTAQQMKGRELGKTSVIILYSVFIGILGILCIYFANLNGLKTYNPVELFDNFLVKSGMNKAKFPPKLLYIFWASLSIITLFTFSGRLKISKPGFLTYIGRNAIFFYFAQGISSSLIYTIVHYYTAHFPDFNKWVAMVVMYIINVILAVGIAQILKKADSAGWKFLEFLRKKSAL